MPYILSTSYCPRVTDISFIDRNSFLDLALTTLRNIKSADKKHWHHRPICRVHLILYCLTQIATLLESTRWDMLAAKAEMDNIVGGANKVKALVSIWRPEFERYISIISKLTIGLVDISSTRTSMLCITSVCLRY